VLGDLPLRGDKQLLDARAGGGSGTRRGTPGRVDTRALAGTGARAGRCLVPASAGEAGIGALRGIGTLAWTLAAIEAGLRHGAAARARTRMPGPGRDRSQGATAVLETAVLGIAVAGTAAAGAAVGPLAVGPAAVSAAAWAGSGRLAHGEAGAWRRPGPGRALGSVRRHAAPFPIGFYPWERRATGLD
jgi:hypothetical protein